MTIMEDLLKMDHTQELQCVYDDYGRPVEDGPYIGTPNEHNGTDGSLKDDVNHAIFDEGGLLQNPKACWESYKAGAWDDKKQNN